MEYQRDGNKYFETRYTSEFLGSRNNRKSAAGHAEYSHNLSGVFGKQAQTFDASLLYQVKPQAQTMERFQTTQIQVQPTTSAKQSYSGYYIKSPGDASESQKRPGTLTPHYEYSLNDYSMRNTQGFQTKEVLPPMGNSAVGRSLSNMQQRQFSTPKLPNRIGGQRAKTGMSDDMLEGHQTFDRTIPSFNKGYGNEKMTSPHRYNYESWSTQLRTQFYQKKQSDSRVFPNQTTQSNWRMPVFPASANKPYPVFRPMIKPNLDRANTVYKRQFGGNGW